MKVVITGMGVVSPLGNTVEELWSNLFGNKSGVKVYPEWKNLVGLKCFLGAPAAPYDVTAIPRSARRTMSRMSEMALIATQNALAQAGLTSLLNPERSLLCMGSTTGSPQWLENYFKKYIEKGGPEGQLSTSFFKVMSHSVAANVVAGLGTSMAILGVASACTTSAQAMILGWELIQTGLYDVVIAGGADELHETSVAVFDNVMAASTGYNDRPLESPRPFDKQRDGLVVAEGAGVVIMESEAHAQKRGQEILATFESGAYTCDATHMSQPQTQAMQTVMNTTLKRAGLEPHQIDYVNAHATATLLGDIEEARATTQVFGSKTPVSSLKGHLGHSLAACGTIESIASIEMLRRGLLIPNRNLAEPDPACGPIHLLQEPTPQNLSRLIKNNFAFGGVNTSLILARYDA
jgi:3-oxoacyl-[acyl-carrier-protein] synthase II